MPVSIESCHHLILGHWLKIVDVKTLGCNDGTDV